MKRTKNRACRSRERARALARRYGRATSCRMREISPSLPEIEVSVVPSQRKAARNAHARAWDRHAEVIALVALFSLFVFVGAICHFLAFRAAAAGRDWFPPLSLFLLGVIFQVHAFLFFAQIAQRSARNSGRGIDS